MYFPWCFQSSQISTINLLLISKVVPLPPLLLQPATEVWPRGNINSNEEQCLIDPISRIDWNWKLFWLHCWWWWCQSLSSTGELCLGLQGIFTMTMMEGITVMLVMLPDTLAAAAATFWMNFSKNWDCWRVQWLHKYFLVPGHFHRLEKEKYLHSFNLNRRILY